MEESNILVVDDNPNNLLSFKEVLAPLNKPVITCDSGREALHIVSSKKVSVILMDVQMPGMNGFEVVDIIKSRKSTENIPVIFITAAYNSTDFVSRGYSHGAVDYITKPVDPDLLRSKVKIFHQIHDQRMEIENLVEELQQKNRDLEESQAKLMQSGQLVQASKMTSLGTLAAGMCHELNNPLAIIKGNTSLLAKSYNLDDSDRRRIKAIEVSCERMRKIVDHLRSFSRSDNADEREILDIGQVVRETFDILKAHLVHNHIKHTITADDGLMVYGNRNRLESVFQNLIINSRDSFLESKIEGPMEISFHCAKEFDGNISIKYRDNAGGMPREVQEKIFEPFFTTKDVGVGTGLGMSISYGIVKEHGGNISVQSQQGEGTCFSLLFPACEGESQGPAPASGADQENSVPFVPDYPTVLIIDDEKEICELLREFIQDEFNVKVCSDPITAVDMVNKEKFDLVLTDLQMPNISGMGIIRTVRTASPETPIIIVSGNATEQLAQEHGVAGYITKPFKSDEAIKTYLKSKMA